MGFVWQNVSRNLVPYLTALENVELPMILAGKYDRNRAKELLEAVELESACAQACAYVGRRATTCAIAIALANNPSVLLAESQPGH